ncbi:MAG: hypothetical protein RLZZ78_758, partial [Armatimonadota bacterium]
MTVSAYDAKYGCFSQLPSLTL